jgi:TPR repeat protein
MGFRSSIAICLVFCLAFSAMAQDAASLDALFRHAINSEYGSGGTVDLPGAIRLYEQAARQGHAPSMVRLGYMRQSAKGMPADLPGAFALYGEAAKRGDLEGQFMYALCFAQGFGTPKDPVAARKLMLPPADAGHQDAQYALGIMTALGEGGPKREAAARRWLDKAASGPDRELAARAATQRDRIDQNLFAVDNSGRELLLGLAAFIILAGALSGGDGGGGGVPSSSYPSSSFGGGSSSSSGTMQTSRGAVTPMNGDITRTLHGTDAMGMGRPVRYP